MDKFIKIFTGLQRAHGCTHVEKKNADGTKIKGKSFVKRERVVDLLWTNHLNGIEPSLGIIPINEDNKCIWGCIDIDSYAGFDHKKLIQNILNYKLPLIVARSKSGGAHVFLFTTVPVDASLMRDKLLSVSAILGYGGAEVFPKQVELKSQDDTGNFLNLPYFNCKNTTRYVFLEDGSAATIEGFFEVYERNKLTPEQLEKLEIKRPQSEFSDGPPCLESLTQTDIKDGRDRIIYQYIQYAKRKWPENWQGKINKFNYKYFDKHKDGPLEDKIVQGKIKFNDGKDLGFKCNEEPMCNHCDKKLCMTRDFGIKGQSIFPVLSDLQKIKLDKPHYYVNVDGERVKLEDITFLLEQRLFQRAVAEQLNKRPPVVKPKEFGQYIDGLLASVEEVDPPKGATKVEQLMDYLEEYCTDRTGTGATKEDMERGNVWTSDNKHHFIFQQFFHQYLNRRKWPEKYAETLQMMAEHCNCNETRISIGKKRRNVMVVDEFEKQSDTYTPKEFKPKDVF